MNEEIKIVIKAVTDSAKKQIGQVSKELDNVGKGSQKASGGFKSAMGGIGKAAKGAVAAVTAVIAAIGALIAGITKLGQATLEYNKEQAKLIAGFQAMGGSAEQAAETYNNLFRYLGDSSKATEAANHLAMITTNQENLAEWTKITQGIYAKFGDSLPIEGLTEAANETLRVGKVTGTLADALNWAGVSEDEFNAKLAATNSYSEREALLRSTLNGLYKDAADIYEKNNKAILDYNESQAKLNAAMGAAGKAAMPLMTAINNLGAAFYTALKPALDVIVPALVTFVNWIAKAVETVAAFFSALTGNSASVKAVSDFGSGASSGLGSAANNADNLSSGLDNAADSAENAEQAIEAAKRATLGFDELNIVSSGGSSSAGSGSGSGSNGGGAGATGPAYMNNLGGLSFSTQVEEGEEGANRFTKIFEKIKSALEDLKEVFAPTINAWSDGFDTIKESVNNSIPHVLNGLRDFRDGFSRIGSYLLNEFVPNVVNSFSVNLAPVITDVLGFAIEETALKFEFMGDMFNRVSEDMVVPALERVETVSTDLFESIGNAWSKHGEPFLNKLSKAFESVREFISNLYESAIKPIVDNLLTEFDKVWTNGLKPLVDEFLDAALEIGNCLLDLYNKIIYPVVSWVLEKIYPVIVNVVNAVVKCIGDMITGISTYIRGIIQTFKGFIQFITGVFTLDWEKAWEGIKNMLGGVFNQMIGIAKTTWASIKLTFSPAIEFFKSLWEGVQNVYSKVESWFKNIFSKAWAAVQGVFSNWGSFFSGLWNRIKTTFSSLGTKISDAIGGSVKSGLNAVIASIENTINKAVGLINGAIDLINQLPGVSVGYVNELKLPRLAKGGIVDSATIAMVGEAGKEAVLPLENNTQWMDRLAEKIATINGNQAPTRLTLKVGERELGYATIDAINRITKQSGGLQLQLV